MSWHGAVVEKCAGSARPQRVPQESTKRGSRSLLRPRPPLFPDPESPFHIAKFRQKFARDALPLPEKSFHIVKSTTYLIES